MKIEPQDLLIRTFNTSGSAWVSNDSGISMYHIPTGITVRSSEGKTQHSNRAKCLTLLEEELCYYEEDIKIYKTKLSTCAAVVEIRKDNGKCYWALDGGKTLVEEEIPLTLYMEIKKFITKGGDGNGK